MKITIELLCNNDAFGQAPDTDIEAFRILSEFAKTLEYATLTEDSGKLRDINGNKVGVWKIAEE